MDRISRDNYEVWFVDYFDGALDTRHREELFEFLEANPDLKAEFEFFENTRVEPETTVQFTGKEKLKKQKINLQNYETWMIALLENDLLGQEKEEVLSFIKNHPHLEKELDLFKSAKLVPDDEIVFPGKRKLRRSAIILSFTPTAKRVLSAAAVLLLLAVSWFFVNLLRPEGNEVAVQQEESRPAQVATADDKPVVKTTEIRTDEQETKKPDEKVERFATAPKAPREALFAGVDKRKRQAVPTEPQPSQPGEGEGNDEEMERMPVLEPQMNLPQEALAQLGPEEGINIPSVDREVNNRLDQMAMSISDVFSREELDELRASNDARKSKDPESLVDLALNKVKEVSRSKDVEFKRTTADKDNSVTYALSVGKGFSISHTRTK